MIKMYSIVCRKLVCALSCWRLHPILISEVINSQYIEKRSSDEINHGIIININHIL